MKSKWHEILPSVVSNPNWIQAWFLITLLFLAWSGVASLIPDHIFKPIAVVMSTVQSLVLFIMRGGKYVVSREEPPDGTLVTPPTIPTGKIDVPQPPAL